MMFLRNRKLVYALIALCIIGTVAVCAWWIMSSIQVMFRSGRAGNAVQSLKTILYQQDRFKARKGRFGTLRELTDEGLLDQSFASGRPIYGYIYSDGGTTADTYCIQATRVSGRTGQADFNVNEIGIVKYRESADIKPLPCSDGMPLRTP